MENGLRMFMRSPFSYCTMISSTLDWFSLAGGGQLRQFNRIFASTLVSLSIDSCSTGFDVRFTVTAFTPQRQTFPLYGGPMSRLMATGPLERSLP